MFTRPEGSNRWPESVKVSWRDGVFEFQLVRTSSLVTADRCKEESAGSSERLLHQLEADIGAVIPTRLPNGETRAK